MRIAVVYSLPSARMLGTPYGETDSDTGEIAKMVKRGLLARGMEVELFPLTEATIPKIKEIKADCVFNLIEWCGGDIALAQRAFSYLRKLNIPITGSSEELFVLTGDKIRMKQRLIELGIPTPRALPLITGEEEIPSDLPYPLLVKPSLEHCSTGLSAETLAHNAAELTQIARKQLAEFAQPVLAEEFIRGRELLVYLVEENDTVRVLPIEEVHFRETDGTGFQTYETKWVEESEAYQNTWVEVAKLSKEEQARIEEVSRQAFLGMGLWGYARFDLRLRDSLPYILETNANPSVYDATEEIKSVEEEVIMGIKFADYLEQIVKAAFRHYERGERV